MRNLVIVVGSGSTRSQATGIQPPRSTDYLPPLDKNFFSELPLAMKTDPQLADVKQYLASQYWYDIDDPHVDSFEAVSSILYTDALSDQTQSHAYNVFLALIRLLAKRLSDTTDTLTPTPINPLYQIIKHNISQKDDLHLTVITFNYDLQVERTLKELNSLRNPKLCISFAFPGCYRLPTSDISRIDGQPRFDPAIKTNQQHAGIPILKLHGSLNWYRGFQERDPSQELYFESEKRVFRIANTDHIPPTWPIRVKSNSTAGLYGYPVIVPPIPNKSAVFRREIRQLWTLAGRALSAATELLVFGYSCPAQDLEAANLFRSTAGRNRKLSRITVIDPDIKVAERFADLANAGSCTWYRDAADYP